MGQHDERTVGLGQPHGAFPFAVGPPTERALTPILLPFLFLFLRRSRLTNQFLLRHLNQF